jgi:hypothetical protein
MYYAAIHCDEFLYIYGTQKKKEGDYLNLHQGFMEVDKIFATDNAELERNRNSIEMAIIEANLKGLAAIPDMSLPPLNKDDLKSEENYFQEWADLEESMGERGFLNVTDKTISWIPVDIKSQITFKIEMPTEAVEETPETPEKVASMEELLSGIKTKVKKVEASVD